ncbi:hypothetical protein [Halanaerobium]|uniref:Apea-like HEPN domain-containing protein n=1 Tax=Halanaerobium saccharolyticum TaxID=43595 RepID=A0A4V3CEE7_9FIRM|nr:hypothetical protein [Halanaerobium]RCW60164.1 hypothetical protein DFR80_1087 [Halanaerobium sp. ST460_2HS_T2]TDO86463.1 hypothetical protein DFR79_11435 [Halanaerobium saccharolyticum]
MLKPNENIQKILISTTSRFKGEYETENLLITHSWIFNDSVHLDLNSSENPYCRNYFTIVVKTPELKRNRNFFVYPNYKYIGDIICIILSIFYGKRFDNHGMIETHGNFSIPNLNQINPIRYTKIGINNHKPRKDIDIELKLDKLKKINRLLVGDVENEKVLNTLLTAGNFYLKAIQDFEEDPNIAYLNLINSGEVLSNFYNYSENALFDENLKEILRQIEEGLDEGSKISKQIKSRLYQVRSKYSLTLTNLLNEGFFNYEGSNHVFALKQKNIQKNIKASYDIRSLYLHEGISFGQHIQHHDNHLNELIIGEPLVEQKRLRKLLKRTPTFIGLERIIRYCLLRFIHLELTVVDEKLNEQPNSR